MAKQFGLGRGLDALMGGSQEDELYEAIQQQADENQGVAVKQTEAPQFERKLPDGITVDQDGTLWVNPSLLKPNPHQPRTYFDEDKLAELTESIRQDGILSPVIIEDAGDGTFYIIAGERRTRAAREAGLEKIPVQLRKYSDAKKLEVALIENIQRTDLNPVEEAQAYYNIMELENITQEEVAKRVGKNRSTVANSLRLLKLPDDMQHALAAGSISAGHARALLSLFNPADQRILFGRIVGQGMSVRQAEQQASDMNGSSRASKTSVKDSEPEKRDPNYVDIEQKFMDALGTKVQLKGGFDKGTITINYFNKDDLDRIYNRIVEKR